MMEETVILGAGMTGLAAGMCSGLPVYEARETPGGICASYYLRADRTRFFTAPEDEEAYRFEMGGGHWVWGGDPLVLHLIRSLVPVKSYSRKAAVYLPDEDLLIPYPIQYHLHLLGAEKAMQAVQEMVHSASAKLPVRTMADWLRASFGAMLCELFFEPFHDLYTSGLWKTISPQDASKSPYDLSLVLQGAFGNIEPAVKLGYNPSFVYPVEGLNVLAQRMAACANVRYGKRVASISMKDNMVYFADGSAMPYKLILSTIPLNQMVEICGLTIDGEPDPFTSVLVTNVGAKKGRKCPQQHWIYIPKSDAGFHRVGFYSNVDASFLPKSARERQDRTSVYIEKSYPLGKKPNDTAIDKLAESIIHELHGWRWIEEADIIDHTWIDVAYAWSVPGSRWRQRALQALEKNNIFQVGRYARWVDQLSAQGISQSIRDGLVGGAVLRSRS